MGFAKAKLGFASQNLGQLLLRPELTKPSVLLVLGYTQNSALLSCACSNPQGQSFAELKLCFSYWFCLGAASILLALRAIDRTEQRLNKTEGFVTPGRLATSGRLE